MTEGVLKLSHWQAVIHAVTLSYPSQNIECTSAKKHPPHLLANAPGKQLYHRWDTAGEEVYRRCNTFHHPALPNHWIYQNCSCL